MRLSEKEKLLAVNRIKNGERISSVSESLNVSRKSLYSWLKKKELKNNFKKGINHHNAKYPKAIQLINKFVYSHPEWGCRRIEKELCKKQIALSFVQINKFLNKIGAETYERRLNYSKLFSGPGRLIKDIRHEVVGHFESGKSVSALSSEYNVSRKTIYKWIKKLQNTGSLADLYVKGEQHPRAIYPKITKEVLHAVIQNPTLSVHSLAKTIPASSFTIWKILDKNGLKTVNSRILYSRTNKKFTFAAPTQYFINRIKSVFETFTPNLAPAPPPVTHGFFNLAGIFLSSCLVTLISSFVLYEFIFKGVNNPLTFIGLSIATVALISGMLFFLYSLKYYITLIVVLSYSQSPQDAYASPKGLGGIIKRVLGIKEDTSDIKRSTMNLSPGLESDLSGVRLKSHPFVSVHIPFYNEKNVVERAIRAATSFKYPGDYEVILCDDSTDETTSIIRRYQKDCLFKNENLKEVKGKDWTMTEVEVRPGVVLKHLHRTTRAGYKGQALNLALSLTDPRTKYVAIFDADFVPYPDTLELFLKYFQISEQGTRHEALGTSNYCLMPNASQIAAVQGYQWHVLNKSENWITRGVRSEYAGSYVIERSGAEIYGGLKQISGSVYMIKKEALDSVGWGSSITEDFELTLKLYEKGYKVLYTPYIQAPAECVSTIKRLVRQRMRWAEGHSFNVKKMFLKLLKSPKLTYAEKLELIYLAPYYLQTSLFLVGTVAWLLSESVFMVQLPFWSELWGWSLIITNMISLPLVNAVGLFVEESEERDYMGLISFVALSYLLVPFQAYASVKGLLEKEEGPWFRTPKTGRITDIFSRFGIFKFLTNMLPAKNVSSDYLKLKSANNRFNLFSIVPARFGIVGKIVLVVLIVFSLTIYMYSRGVPQAVATNPTTPFVISHTNSSVLTGGSVWKLLDNTTDTTNSATTVTINNKNSVPAWYLYAAGTSTTTAISGNACPSGASGNGWVFDTPFGGSGGSIATGAWTFYYNLTDNQNNYVGNLEYCVYAVSVSGSTISSSRLLYDSSTDASPPSTDVWIGATSNSSYTTSSISSSVMTFNPSEYLYIDYYNNLTGSTGGKTSSYTSTMNIGGSSIGTSMRIVTPAVTIPENSLFLIIFVPLIPIILSGQLNKKYE